MDPSTKFGKEIPSRNLREKRSVDTEIKAKRDNIFSEVITFRITKAKAKENSRGGGGVELNSR